MFQVSVKDIVLNNEDLYAPASEETIQNLSQHKENIENLSKKLEGIREQINNTEITEDISLLPISTPVRSIVKAEEINNQKKNIYATLAKHKELASYYNFSNRNIIFTSKIQKKNFAFIIVKLQVKFLQTALPEDLFLQVESLIYQLNFKQNDVVSILFKNNNKKNQVLCVQKCSPKTPLKVYLYNYNGKTLFVTEDGRSLSNRFLCVNSNLPLKRPLVINSAFGRRRHPKTGRLSMHSGIDLSAGTGTPIYSIESGIIVKAVKKWDYGNVVFIKHNTQYETRYAHMSKILVKEGDIVKKGDIIGLVGSTGMATGPHLHFEVLKKKVKINPVDGPFYLDTHSLTTVDRNLFLLTKKYCNQLIEEILGKK